MADVSQNIKKERLKRGMNQTELAERIGVTRQTVSSWERGISFPDIPMLMKLSEVLDVEIDELLYPLAAGKRKRIISEPLTPRFIILSIILYTVLLIWGGGLVAVPVFKKVIGGGVREEYIFILYWGLILLVGYIAVCVCLITEYLDNGV